MRDEPSLSLCPAMSKPVHPPGLTIPPGADALPSEDGVPLETNRHRLETNLLCDALDRHLASRRSDYFVGGSMFFYFSLLQTRKNDFRGPDVLQRSPELTRLCS